MNEFISEEKGAGFIEQIHQAQERRYAQGLWTSCGENISDSDGTAQSSQCPGPDIQGLAILKDSNPDCKYSTATLLTVGITYFLNQPQLCYSKNLYEYKRAKSETLDLERPERDIRET